MEKMSFIMFCLGAFSLAVGIVIQPYVKTLWQWCKHSISHRKNTQSTTNYQQQIDDLQSQVDNLAEVLKSRDKNRKSNTRKNVREYLAELQTK